MKLKLGRFIGSYYLFFLIMEVLRELLRSPEYWEQFLQYPFEFLFSIFQSSILFLGYALLAYLFLFYRYKKQSLVLTIVGLLFAALVVIGMRYVVEEVIIKAITGYGNYYEGTTAWYYIADNLYYAILYTAFGISIYFIRYSMFRDSQQQQLLIENKTTELAFLRSQVNPHFLFNMLNNIYSLINMGSDKALMATDKLSKLLRYSLYESETLVTVENEIQSIKDYISLQELRFRESVQTTITIDPNVLHREIAPFIIMPLVENAFKHGVVTDPKHPIKINIAEQENGISMIISNKIAQREKDEVGGIGIENLRKRLKLIYAERHTYNLERANDIFKITITISTT